MDLSGLQAVKEKRTQAKAKSAWQPLRLSDLHPGVYLACDQSVRALGLVLFEATPEGRYAVHLAETFTEPTYVGHVGLLANTGRIQDRLEEYFDRWIPVGGWGIVHAVHEMPPVNKGKMARPEVSLLSAYAFVRAVKNRYLLLAPVGKQSHSKLICGEANADKKIHHAALKEHFDAIRGADELITNEATRDALSIALAAAYRGIE
jgi:hypothetical protein